MKSKALLTGLFLSTVLPSYAFSTSIERCWSPEPILKLRTESKKLQTEEGLCNIDLYSDPYSLCPKVNSSSPGILVVQRSKTISDQDFRENYCKNMEGAKKTVDAKVVAKMKQSINCTHVTAGPAYYRISEFLGGIRTPVSVFKMMARDKFAEVAVKAPAILVRNGVDIKTKNKPPIASAWNAINGMLKNPSEFPETSSRLLMENGTMVYNALSENVTGEYNYRKVSGYLRSNDPIKKTFDDKKDPKYQYFMLQEPFLEIASSKSVVEIAGGKSFQALAAKVVQMKDVSSMIVIDQMLKQQDRMGNIHFKYKLYKYDQGKIIETKSEAEQYYAADDKPHDKIPTNEQARISAGEVLVKEMILKDNDCAITKSNNMADLEILEKVRHINPKFYNQVQKLANYMKTAEGHDYLLTQLRIPKDSASVIKENIIKSANTLKMHCQNGKLSLDLDLEKLLEDPTFKANNGLKNPVCEVNEI